MFFFNNYSSGLIQGDNVVFSTNIKLDICNPVEDIEIKCKVKDITNSIDVINSNLLTLQTRNWVDKEQFGKISSIFSRSCFSLFVPYK